LGGVVNTNLHYRERKVNEVSEGEKEGHKKEKWPRKSREEARPTVR